MPFGKYEGWFLIDIPEYYIVWYSNKGFPKGELGEQLKLIYELKLNGLEELIRNIKKKYPKPQNNQVMGEFDNIRQITKKYWLKMCLIHQFSNYHLSIS